MSHVCVVRRAGGASHLPRTQQSNVKQMVGTVLFGYFINRVDVSKIGSISLEMDGYSKSKSLYSIVNEIESYRCSISACNNVSIVDT